MYERYIEERCRRILEDNGGLIADKARTILLEDPALKDLRPPLEFVSKNWRDLTPALTSLSCEAVGGRPDETYDVALALSLMHLSLYIFDDTIDGSRSKSFRPTLFGEFGGGTSLILGGLASAKAFSILNEMNMEKDKRQVINRLIWDFLVKMAKAETVNFRLRSEKNYSYSKKIWKIKMEAADTETCLRIGAIIGDGSGNEIDHLGKYGFCLGVILALWNDFRVSVNLTLELAEKIRSGRFPYSLLWACGRSEKLRGKIEELTGANTIEQTHIKEIVEEILATKAFDNTARIIKRYTQLAKDELVCLKKNKATQTLKSFVGFQPRLFMESLSMFQGAI
jgi:geranylgeranyl diphosphate synthase type I